MPWRCKYSREHNFCHSQLDKTVAPGHTKHAQKVSCLNLLCVSKYWPSTFCCVWNDKKCRNFRLFKMERLLKKRGAKPWVTGGGERNCKKLVSIGRMDMIFFPVKAEIEEKKMVEISTGNTPEISVVCRFCRAVIIDYNCCYNSYNRLKPIKIDYNRL